MSDLSYDEILALNAELTRKQWADEAAIKESQTPPAQDFPTVDSASESEPVA